MGDFLYAGGDAVGVRSLSLLITLVGLTIIQVADPARAASIYLREAGTGLTTISAAPSAVLTLEIVLDAPSPGLEGVQFDLSWDGGPTPVLGSVSTVDQGVYQIYATGTLGQSGPGSPGAVNILLFNADATDVIGTGIVIANVLATATGSVGDSTSFSFSNPAANHDGFPVTPNVQGATITIVPEPSTAVLLAAGLMGLGVQRRRH